jgi:hypothetical protein
LQLRIAFLCLWLLPSAVAQTQTIRFPGVGNGISPSSPPVSDTSSQTKAPKSSSPGFQPQTTSSAPNLPLRRASLEHLYWHFLIYQNHLDRAAAAHEQQRKDGNWLRNHFQQRLSFSDAQFAIVRQTAQRLEPELKEIATKAKVIIEADRAWLKSNSAATVVSAGAVSTPAGQRRGIPATPGRAQLKELQQQHEATIQKEVSSLRAALGPESAAKLDNFIQTVWIRNVTSTHFQPRLQRALRAPAKIPPPEVSR